MAGAQALPFLLLLISESALVKVDPPEPRGYATIGIEDRLIDHARLLLAQDIYDHRPTPPRLGVRPRLRPRNGRDACLRRGTAIRETIEIQGFGNAAT